MCVFVIASSLNVWLESSTNLYGLGVFTARKFLTTNLTSYRQMAILITFLLGEFWSFVSFTEFNLNCQIYCHKIVCSCPLLSVGATPQKPEEWWCHHTKMWWKGLLHNEAFWRRAGQLPTRSENSLREQRKQIGLEFLWWLWAVEGSHS